MKTSILTLVTLFCVSTVALASVQEDFNQAEHVNKEWQAKEMQQRLNDLETEREWDAINASNSSDE